MKKAFRQLNASPIFWAIVSTTVAVGCAALVVGNPLKNDRRDAFYAQVQQDVKSAEAYRDRLQHETAPFVAAENLVDRQLASTWAKCADVSFQLVARITVPIWPSQQGLASCENEALGAASGSPGFDREKAKAFLAALPRPMDNTQQ